MQTHQLSHEESSLYVFDDEFHDEKQAELRVAANFAEEPIELLDFEGNHLRFFEVTS